ncbi:MAG: flagellin, partial [Acidobacteria bacterium]|nr:flagellin [Acidobacteriota bacterium]
ASFKSHADTMASIAAATNARDAAQTASTTELSTLNAATTKLNEATEEYTQKKNEYDAKKLVYDKAYLDFTNNPTDSNLQDAFKDAREEYVGAQKDYLNAKKDYDAANVQFNASMKRFNNAQTQFDAADKSIEKLEKTRADIEEIAIQAASYAGLLEVDFAAIKTKVQDLQAAVNSGHPTPEQLEQYEKFNEIFDGRDKIIGFMRNADTTNASLASATLLTHASAASALGSIRDSLNEISNMRGTIGAGMNRLLAGISVMQTQSRNTLSAESSIRDANMAEEITSMTRYQILAQTGIAALAHSNANSQTVLRLLQ